MAVNNSRMIVQRGLDHPVGDFFNADFEQEGDAHASHLRRSRRRILYHPRLRDADREFAHAGDHAHPLSDADRAARIQQVERNASTSARDRRWREEGNAASARRCGTGRAAAALRLRMQSNSFHSVADIGELEVVDRVLQLVGETDRARTVRRASTRCRRCCPCPAERRTSRSSP